MSSKRTRDITEVEESKTTPAKAWQLDTGERRTHDVPSIEDMDAKDELDLEKRQMGKTDTVVKTLFAMASHLRVDEEQIDKLGGLPLDQTMKSLTRPEHMPFSMVTAEDNIFHPLARAWNACQNVHDAVSMSQEVFPLKWLFERRRLLSERSEELEQCIDEKNWFPGLQPWHHEGCMKSIGAITQELDKRIEQIAESAEINKSAMGLLVERGHAQEAPDVNALDMLMNSLMVNDEYAKQPSGAVDEKHDDDSVLHTMVSADAADPGSDSEDEEDIPRYAEEKPSVVPGQGSLTLEPAPPQNSEEDDEEEDWDDWESRGVFDVDEDEEEDEDEDLPPPQPLMQRQISTVVSHHEVIPELEEVD